MMNLRPRLDEALLRPRKPAANALDRIEGERGQGVLIQGVEVRPMVRGTDLHEHPNDYSEKARQFRHGGTLHRPSGFVGPTFAMSRGAVRGPGFSDHYDGESAAATVT